MPPSNAVDLLALSQQHPVVVFDGVCNLCNGTVNFLLRQDRRARLRFAPLQAACSQLLLLKLGRRTEEFEIMLLLENGVVHQKSTADLRISRHLPGTWPLLYGLILVPRFLCDRVYDFITRNRYRWFGRQDACMIPNAWVRGQFVQGRHAAPSLLNSDLPSSSACLCPLFRLGQEHSKYPRTTW